MRKFQTEARAVRSFYAILACFAAASLALSVMGVAHMIEIATEVREAIDAAR